MLETRNTIFLPICSMGAVFKSDWLPTKVDDAVLANYVKAGCLDPQDVIGWRTGLGEDLPNPKEGEIVVFVEHLERGFKPPGSKFLRDALNFMNVRLQDLGPNSISNLSQFQVLCEAYLRIEPSVPLFWYFFHLNRQTEFHNGPSLELGGVNVQRRRDSPFPALTMPSHPKGWGESWFYCKETSPAGENKLQGYRPSRLPVNFKLPDKLTEEEESEFVPILSELRSLTNNGLTGVDLIRCWVEWRILPLSRRDGLMCEFDGTLDHPQCYFHTALTEKDIVAIIRKLTGEPAAKCGQIGLKPFCKINPAPKVTKANSPSTFISSGLLSS